MSAKDDEFLRDEYLSTQKAVEDFDGKALTIKAWSVTASGAALSAAYLEHEKLVLLIAAGGACVFWFIDALWKVNQRVYYPRLREIEQHFAGGPRTKPFQVSEGRRAENKKRPKFRRTLKVMPDPIAALPHVAVCLAGIVLFFAAPPSAEGDKTAPSATIKPHL
jgi:hypothetical protein